MQDDFLLQKKGDERGNLYIAEAGKEIPFTIKRFYLIRDVPEGETRGGHAHKRTEQAVICLRGSCTLITDDGMNTSTVSLNAPEKGALLPSRIWHSLTGFSADAIVLVVASELYDESDYLRDHQAFIEYIRT